MNIIIQPCDVGCVVHVGCVTIAFTHHSIALREIERYLDDPVATADEYGARHRRPEWRLPRYGHPAPPPSPPPGIANAAAGMYGENAAEPIDQVAPSLSTNPDRLRDRNRKTGE